MGLPANWHPRVEHAPTAKFRLTMVPFVILGLAGSILVCTSILQQSTRLWLPPVSSLQGAPQANAILLLLWLQGGHIAAFFLLFVPTKETKSLGAGIALGAAALHFGLEGLRTLGMTAESMWGFKLETAWMKGVYPFLLFFVFLQFWVAVTSLLAIVTDGRARKWVFLAGGFVLAFVSFSGFVKFTGKAHRAFTNFVTEKRAEDQAAHDAVRAIAWCGIQLHAKNPGAGYPLSIEEMAGGANCRRSWSLAGKPDYRFTYQASTGGRDGEPSFFVMGTSTQDTVVSLQSYGSDESGILLVLSNAAPGPKGWNRIADSSPSGYAGQLQNCLRDFAADHTQSGFPRDLSEAKNCPYPFSAVKPQVRNVYRLQNYVLTYQPASSSLPIRRYTIDVRCMDYGGSCIRNLYVDPDQVTGTPENRPATKEDPDSSECETWSASSLGGCHD